MTEQVTGKISKSKQSPAKNQGKVMLRAATLMALGGVVSYEGIQAVAATATLPVIARLVRAIELTVNTTLDFGTLAMTMDRAGKATIDPGVNRLFIDDNSSLSLAGGKPAAGRMFIRGSEYPVAISLDSPTVKLTNGTDSVLVTNFNLLTANGGTKMTFTPTENTYSLSIPVGATLRTRTGQVSGTYVGTARIFASYQ
ncbi:MAG: DUF4402 domain-containing protein [Rhodospirillales bacterium]|nr:DUF4402 domain-containing protein [Rhodospirillales bacterium]MCB9994907.1 DUF4402 domain-containing protein [Rhodospirillales bacterium]